MKKCLLIRIVPVIITLCITALPPVIELSPHHDQNTASLYAQKKRVKKFALNFKDVEISEFINVMSQLIGKNIIIADNVKGKITISSAKKVPISEAYNVMKSILEIKGLAVVESENLIKVIPIKDAVKKNAEVIIDKKGDVSLEEDKTITFLLDIKDADAGEIANALKQVASSTTSIIVYGSLNTIIFSGNSAEINGLVKIAKTLDRPVADEEIGEESISRGNIHIVHLENANAEDLAGVLSRVPFSDTAKIDTSPPKTTTRTSRKASRVTKTQAVRPSNKQQLSIIANKDTNSLIITATPDEFREIKRIIKELDIVREQVLIEALIVEVGADNTFSFGINWMLGGEKGSHGFGGSAIIKDMNTNAGEVLGKKTILPMNSGFQLGYIYDASVLGFALLNATAYDNKFNIISTPQILTIDNQEAELNVAEEVPIQTNTRISDSGTQFNTWDYKSVGIKLKITPHITKKKHITLDLYQEANQVLEYDTGSDKPPTLGKRDLKTKVTIFDGKTIVIGGLIRNDKTTTQNKVPGLGDIPILGWLFKTHSTVYRKTNLLVFITPHIVTKQERIDAVTKQKRNVQNRMRKY